MNNIFYIDNHIHGSFGINFNYANYDEIKYVLKELFKKNIRGICPTLVGETPENMRQTIENQASLIEGYKKKIDMLEFELSKK